MEQDAEIERLRGELQRVENEAWQARTDFIAGLSMFTGAIVNTLLEIDRLPAEARTTDQLISYFEDLEGMTDSAERLQGDIGGAAQARRMWHHFREHLAEMREVSSDGPPAT